MDITLPKPSSTPANLPPATRNFPLKRWILIVIALIIIGVVVVVVLWRPKLLPVNQSPTPEQLAAQELAKKSADAERTGNLVAIHLLLAKYQQQHGQYPDQLNQLSDIKGYAPSAAQLIAEAKLENGQPAYSYKKLDKGYELCANQITDVPKCEGPKK